MVVLFLIFSGTAKLFSTAPAPFCIPTNSAQKWKFLILTNTYCAFLITVILTCMRWYLIGYLSKRIKISISKRYEHANNINDHWQIKGLKNLVYTYNGILLSFRKGLLQFVTTWMSLEDIMLSEISQTQKDNCWMILLIWGIYNSQTQKQRAEWWLPEGEGEWGSVGTRFQLSKMGKFERLQYCAYKWKDTTGHLKLVQRADLMLSVLIKIK